MAERFGVYQGIVMDRNDPTGCARIKVKIPGIYDPMSDWIYPMGMFDCVEGRGVFCVPSLGALVSILFLQGDALKISSARYISGPWAQPNGVSDVPAEAPTPNADIVVFGFKGFAIVIDERVGQRKATLLDRNGGSKIEFNIETKDITISSENDVVATAQRDWKINVNGNVEVIAAQQVEVKVGSQSILKADAALGNPLLDGTSEVKIGQGATDFVALKTDMLLWMLTHRHEVPAVMSGTSIATSLPSTTPIPPTTWSTKTKAE